MKKIVFFLFVLVVVVLCGKVMTDTRMKQTEYVSGQELSPEQRAAVLDRVGVAGEWTQDIQEQAGNIPDEVEAFADWLKEKIAEGEVELAGLPDQIQELYEKYGLTVVENANDAINEAVENAVTSAAKGFFENLADSVSGIFQNLFS